MNQFTDPTNLHRTAKYFMDNGRAATPEAAVDLLHTFGLAIQLGPEAAESAAHQTALLTLVNVASRTLLGGIEIVGLPEAPCRSRLDPTARSLEEAVRALGGRPVYDQTPGWPCAVIGTPRQLTSDAPSWRLTWEGWRGGVVPLRDDTHLVDDNLCGLAPALAAAVCAAEAFAFHAADHPLAGRRGSGMSLWRPGACWYAPDPTEPPLAFLPSQLWIIGLGNLGQAFSWLLACLPFSFTARPVLLLQDFDSMTPANVSTSLLTSERDEHRKKTRVVADWLECRGFNTIIEERRFGKWTQRANDEPAAALCGVDNALARASLESAGFGLIVEAGLGAGPQGFRNMSMHTFPGSRTAAEIWSNVATLSPSHVEEMPAYQVLRQRGRDKCGLTQLASRTVAVPFVSLTAGCLVISEVLRRLHGGLPLEVASLSLLSLDDIEAVSSRESPYSFGHVPVETYTRAVQHGHCPLKGADLAATHPMKVIPLPASA